MKSPVTLDLKILGRWGFGYYHCVETDYVQDSKRRVHLHNLYTVNLRILQANLTNLFV